MEISGRNPISAGLAIDSFRKMGFNVGSAICEIIDNSLEANATSIEITIKYLPKSTLQTYRRIEKFVFVDNGDGMENDTLYDCLVLGEGTKRLLKNGIGKFGVGATLGGISQAKLIEVYSKTKTGKWLYTKLDLDLLNQGIGIPEPEVKSPPAEYTENLDNQGTVVIWDNVDVDESEKDMENAAHLIGRIYRKFISLKKIEKYIPEVLNKIDNKVDKGDYLIVEDSDGKQKELSGFLKNTKTIYLADQHYLDLFGRNGTSATNSIFKIG